MNDDIESEPENAEISRSQELRSEIQNVRSDLQNLSDTFQNEEHNAKHQTAYTFSKHKRKIAGLLLIAIGSYFAFFRESFSIPPEAVAFTIGGIIAAFVAYVPAKRIADMFVTDTRVPILEMDSEDFEENNEADVSVYAVPREKVPEIEVYEGDMFDMQTREMGKGYQVEKFINTKIEEKEYLIAKGTWMGEKSSLELAREIGNISEMRNVLKPKAQKGFAYTVMWPSIMQELQSSVANMITREIEGVTVFKGKALRSEIDDITEKYNPDNIEDKIAEEDMGSEPEAEDIEEIELEGEGGMVQMLAGDD